METSEIQKFWVETMERSFMTKLKFYALFGYLIFFGLKAYALTNFDEAQLFSMNVISNGGFESDKAFWLQSSGQAFFVTSVQSEVGSGLKSAKLMGPGLQRIKGELFPIPNSMKTSTTCILRCQWLNTTGAVGSCYAEDSLGVLIPGATINFAAGANWQQNDVVFTCPATGSFRAVFEATPASGQSVYVDQVYLGPTVAGSGGGGGNFANRTLSNLLSPTSVNQDLIPATGNEILGSVSNQWAALYVRSIAQTNGTAPLLSIRNQVTNTVGANIEISTATNSSGTDSGALQLFTGANINPAGGSGDIFLTTGDANNSALVGDIILQAGGPTAKGDIHFNESSLSGASNGWVWTLQDNTTGKGAWAANPASGGLVEINPLGTPYLVTALDASTNGLSPSLVNQRGVYNIQSDSAGVRNMTVNPQINGCNGGNLMKELVVRGTSATQKVRFNNGNGMRLQSGSKVLGNGGTLNLYCDGVDWVEK